MTTFAVALALHQRSPVWLVDFEDAHVRISSGGIKGSTASYWPLIDEDGVKLGAVSLDPIECTTSIGSAVVTVADLDRVFSDVLSLGLGLTGSVVSVKLGFEDVAEADYRTVFRGLLARTELLSNHRGYRLVLNDALRLLQRQVVLTAAQAATVTLTANPLDLLLQVLVSTGTGSHGAYDTLAATNGLGLDPAIWVDVAAIEAERDSFIAGLQVRFILRSPESALAFFTRELLRPFGAYLYITSAGKVAARFIRPVALPGDTTPITDATMTAPLTGVLDLFDYLVNQIVVRYDYDSSLRQYAATVTYDDADLQAFHGRPVTVEVASQGVRTAFGGATVASRIRDRLMATWGLFQPRVHLEATLAALDVGVGSFVLVSAATVPVGVLFSRAVKSANVGPAYFRITPRFAGHHAAGVSDYTGQTDAQKLVGWSVCAAGSGGLSDGNPGYALGFQQWGGVAPQASVDGVEYVPVQILTRDVDVAGDRVGLDGIILGLDPTIRFGLISPVATVDYPAATTVERATYWWVSSAATGTMSDGGRSYALAV